MKRYALCEIIRSMYLWQLDDCGRDDSDGELALVLNAGTGNAWSRPVCIFVNGRKRWIKRIDLSPRG